MTRDLYSSELVREAEVFLCHTVLMQISTEQLLSLQRVAPKYLRLVISTNCSSLPAYTLLMLLVIFCADYYSTPSLCLWCTSVGTVLKCSILLPLRLMSVNCRLRRGLPPMEMDMWWSWSDSCMIFSRNKLNRMGESKHPRWTPTVFLKKFCSWLFKKTTLLEFSYSPLSTLKLLRTCHRPACQSLSNALKLNEVMGQIVLML